LHTQLCISQGGQPYYPRVETSYLLGAAVVAAESILLVTGPTGCGKSTIVKRVVQELEELQGSFESKASSTSRFQVPQVIVIDGSKGELESPAALCAALKQNSRFWFDKLNASTGLFSTLLDSLKSLTPQWKFEGFSISIAPLKEALQRLSTSEDGNLADVLQQLGRVTQEYRRLTTASRELLKVNAGVTNTMHPLLMQLGWRGNMRNS
jgi:energy-coupling factor transporter ATP-binding protein EcfA2